MRTITNTFNVFSYDELSKEAKDKALNDYRRDNDYAFLEEYIRDMVYQELEERGIKDSGITLTYDLSYNKGYPYVYFYSKTLYYKGVTFYLTTTHSDRPMIELENEYDEGTLEYEAKNKLLEEFIGLYDDICKKATKYGLDEIAYEDSEEYIKDLFDANEYEFLEDGSVYR